MSEILQTGRHEHNTQIGLCHVLNIALGQEYNCIYDIYDFPELNRVWTLRRYTSEKGWYSIYDNPHFWWTRDKTGKSKRIKTVEKAIDNCNNIIKKNNLNKLKDLGRFK